MGKNSFTIKDLYAQYWRNRDLEIQYLWQRSVVLTAFMVLFLTGYGAFALNIFCKGEHISFEDDIVPHLIGFALSIIGVIFSIFWIALAKASKAIVESYEHAIAAIETRKGFFNVEISMAASESRCNLPGYDTYDKKDSLDDCLFCTKGGKYSPSKINIAIGQVILVVWLLVMVLHLFLVNKMYKINLINKILEKIKDNCGILTAILLVIIFILIIWKVILKAKKNICKNINPIITKFFKAFIRYVFHKSIFSLWLGSRYLDGFDCGKYRGRKIVIKDVKANFYDLLKEMVMENFHFDVLEENVEIKELHMIIQIKGDGGSIKIFIGKVKKTESGVTNFEKYENQFNNCKCCVYTYTADFNSQVEFINKLILPEIRACLRAFEVYGRDEVFYVEIH